VVDACLERAKDNVPYQSIELAPMIILYSRLVRLTRRRHDATGLEYQELTGHSGPSHERHTK
jgi:hypothetical protein